MTYQEAVGAFRQRSGADNWGALPFFAEGGAARVAAAVDARAAAGAAVLPAAADVFNALEATPLAKVKAVILGQDPYPTPGDAHGLAFSVLPGRRLPRSLANIIQELEADLGYPRPRHGSLAAWAKSGVLLLNACLTVEAGAPGAHRRLGWQALADQAVATVSAGPHPCVFILWGNEARRHAAQIDAQKHLIIESAHPSPLSARHGFFGSRPFSRANAWLGERGRQPIDWRLG